MGEKNVFLGVYCLSLGVVLMTLYICCLVALIQENLQKSSCYRIMLALGCADLVCLLLNCFLNGFFLLQGYVFCSSLYFLYSTGCLLDAVWAAEASLSILLAVNRCADFWKFKFFKALFEGFAVNIWLGVVALYSFYFFMFPSPPLFSSIHSGLWFLDPYDDIDYEGRDHELYSNWALLANNVTLVIALPVLYSALVLSIKFSQTNSGTNKHHMQVAIQALMICLLNFFSAALYVYMHIWPTHVFLNIVCLLGWQGSSGAGGVIYLIFNKVIRKAVLQFWPWHRKTMQGSSMVFAIGHPSTPRNAHEL